MEYLPINQQFYGHQLMFLLAPLLSHLVSISCTSFFNHSIFYGILILLCYSLELFDTPIVALNVIFEDSFCELFASALPEILLVLYPKEVLEFFPNIKKYGLNPVTGETVQL